jgi:hypothetical protein
MQPDFQKAKVSLDEHTLMVLIDRCLAERGARERYKPFFDLIKLREGRAPSNVPFFAQRRHYLNGDKADDTDVDIPVPEFVEL